MVKDYEDIILVRMYDKKLFGMNYKSTEKVAGMIKWRDIQQKYRVKKSFSNVISHLISKGFIEDHGKRGDVASLTKLGIFYVEGLQEDYKLSLP
jgi:hypothetical protein